ncbi:DNA (cytosine-5-)-methyltransferase [Weissella phage PWc]|nr:DNA (cytosine-5-)-methyltransferase [Weissella phage PWc]
MKFLDLFAGIGGIRLGLERSGHTPVGYVEIDKFARQSYQAMYDTTDEWTATDITKVTDEEWRKFNGKVELIAGGFPCQAFSIAGNRKGFMDETRGTLFFEIARAVEQIKPQFVFLENVKGLLNHEKGNTFRTVISTLDELGYDVEWSVLNSKYFGVPHNRERVYIVGHSRDGRGREVLPIFGQDRTVNSETIKQLGNLKETVPLGDNPQVGRVYSEDSISPTLNTRQGGGRESKVLVREATKKGYDIATVGDSINMAQPNSKTRRGRVGHGLANTLVTGSEQATLTEELRIRKITPRECWRLQAFPDELFDRAQATGMSDSQLYKQAGNSVTVNVIEYIGNLIGE